jgi:hypothetical protein
MPGVEIEYVRNSPFYVASKIGSMELYDREAEIQIRSLGLEYDNQYDTYENRRTMDSDWRRWQPIPMQHDTSPSMHHDHRVFPKDVNGDRVLVAPKERGAVIQRTQAKTLYFGNKDDFRPMEMSQPVFDKFGTHKKTGSYFDVPWGYES